MGKRFLPAKIMLLLAFIGLSVDNTGFVYDGIGPYDSGRDVRKPIYYAHRQMTRLLQYWNGSKPEKIEIAEGVFVYRFRFNDHEDRRIIVAWTGD